MVFHHIQTIRKRILNHKQSKLSQKVPVKSQSQDVPAELYLKSQTHYTVKGRSIYMVAGSDRIREFDALLKKYNGTKARHVSISSMR